MHYWPKVRVDMETDIHILELSHRRTEGPVMHRYQNGPTVGISLNCISFIYRMYLRSDF